MSSYIASFKSVSVLSLYWFFVNYIFNIIRHFKIRIEAKLNGGSIEIGKNVKFYHKVTFQGKGKVVIKNDVIFGYRLAGLIDNRIIIQVRNSGSRIIIEDGVQIMNGTEILCTEEIKIGKDTLIAAGVKILDSDFHNIDPILRMSPSLSKKVLIGQNVWLGMDVMVLKGVSIGSNSVIGAKSLVSSGLPANSICAGVPCKILRYI